VARRIIETKLRVRYAETDQMGIVYHANYLIWMEVGRVEYCRAAGIVYRDLERDEGVLLAVVEANCRFVAPAFYDEEVAVKTWVEEGNARMLRFGYEMTGGDGRRLATGGTKHIFLNRERKPMKLPVAFRAAFGI
jgi:acyl-CoA thioester hydrolase